MTLDRFLRYQTLLGVLSPLVAVVLAFVLLGDSFTVPQWIGAGLFLISVLLIRRDTGLQIADEDTWWLSLFPEPVVEDKARQSSSPTRAAQRRVRARRPRPWKGSPAGTRASKAR